MLSNQEINLIKKLWGKSRYKIVLLTMKLHSSAKLKISFSPPKIYYQTDFSQNSIFMFLEYDVISESTGIIGFLIIFLLHVRFQLIRDSSQIMSAFRGWGVWTPHPPFVSDCQQLAYAPYLFISTQHLAGYPLVNNYYLSDKKAPNMFYLKQN